METSMDRESRDAVARDGASGSFLLARPAAMLRVEGATMLAGSVLLYWANGGSWWLFALLLLAPDLSMLGYLAGPRVGAVVYNAFHSYPLPAALGLVGLFVGAPLAVGSVGVVRPHRHGPADGLRVEVPHGLQGHPPAKGLRVVDLGSLGARANVRSERA